MIVEQTPPPSEDIGPVPPDAYPPVLILGIQLLACVMFGAAAALLYQTAASFLGRDVELIYSRIVADALPGERWQMRAFLALSHLMTFIAAGAAVVYLFYPPARRAFEYLQARQRPTWSAMLGGVVLMLLSIPLVLYIYELNRALPIPEDLRQAEAQANEMLKGLLRMDDGWELAANLALIALLPSIGEELVFRGVVQQQLFRLVRHPWAAIALSAAVFSFAHFQFEGFFPRLLLGVLLGWLYYHFRNFWVPVAAHFANNALQVMAQYLYQHNLSSFNLEDDIAVPPHVALFSAALTLSLLSWLRRQR